MEGCRRRIHRRIKINSLQGNRPLEPHPLSLASEVLRQDFRKILRFGSGCRIKHLLRIKKQTILSVPFESAEFPWIEIIHAVVDDQIVRVLSTERDGKPTANYRPTVAKVSFRWSVAQHIVEIDWGNCRLARRAEKLPYLGLVRKIETHDGACYRGNGEQNPFPEFLRFNLLRAVMVDPKSHAGSPIRSAGNDRELTGTEHNQAARADSSIDGNSESRVAKRCKAA